jgi:uncharacterized membrane protein
MNQNIKNVAFWGGILGAIKLITDAFGYNIITDEQVNQIANGIASLCTVIGVALGVVFGKEQ